MRRAFLAALVVAALPVRAHGETLIYYCGAILYGIPAAILLLAPWHRLRFRLIAVAVLIAGVALFLGVFANLIDHTDMSAAVEWMVMLSPTLLAFAVAIFLRRKYPRFG